MDVMVKAAEAGYEAMRAHTEALGQDGGPGWEGLNPGDRAQYIEVARGHVEAPEVVPTGRSGVFRAAVLHIMKRFAVSGS